MILIAIDPGAKGGIAIRHNNTIDLHKIPETPQDLCKLLAETKTMVPITNLAGAFSTTESAHDGGIKCYLEQVSGFVGGVGQPGSAMFSFGRGYGQIEGILVALQIPFECVRPQKWQAALSVTPSGVEKAHIEAGMTPDQIKAEKTRAATANSLRKRAHKTQLKEMAQRLFPYHHITLDTCDALLILEYGRRQERLAETKNPQATLAL